MTAQEESVKIFQYGENLTQDGVGGPRTWSALLADWTSGNEPG